MTSFEDCSFNHPITLSVKNNKFFEEKAKAEFSLSCNSNGTITLESKSKQRNKVSKVVVSDIKFRKFEGTYADGNLEIIGKLSITFTDNRILESSTLELISIKFDFSRFTPDINNMKYLLSVVKEVPTNVNVNINRSNLPPDHSPSSSNTVMTDTTSTTRGSATSTRLPLTLNQSIYEFLTEKHIQCQTLPLCTILTGDNDRAGMDDNSDINGMYTKLTNCNPIRLNGSKSLQNDEYLYADPDPDLSNIDFNVVFPKAKIVECVIGDSGRRNANREKPWLRLMDLAENTSFKGATAPISSSGPVYMGLDQGSNSEKMAVEDMSLSSSLPTSSAIRAGQSDVQSNYSSPMQDTMRVQEQNKQHKVDNNKQERPNRAMVSYFCSGQNMPSLFKA